VLAAVVLAALAAVVAWRVFLRPGAPPDPLARFTARAAADSADRLIAAGRHYEALPYIARVERIAGETSADFDARAATADNNATVQVFERDGMPIPITRSTIERVGLIRQAMTRLERAERRATQPVQRRNIIVVRAGQLCVWGLVREGYAEYRRAHEVHALEPHQLSEAGWIEKLLGNPIEDPNATRP